MVAVAGVTLIKFFEPTTLVHLTAAGFIVIGIVIGIIGLVRFIRMHGRLHK